MRIVYFYIKTIFWWFIIPSDYHHGCIHIHPGRTKPNRHFIGHHKAVAYCALPEGCSSGFVYWFTVWCFLKEYSLGTKPRLKYSLPLQPHTGKLRHITNPSGNYKAPVLRGVIIW